MSSLWVALLAPVAAALAAALVRKPAWVLWAALLAGFGVGAGRAAEPTLFRVENGPSLAFVLFGLPCVAYGLAVGLIARALLASRAGPPGPSGER